VSKTSRKMKALGKLQLGVRQEAKGGTLWVWSSLSCVPFSQRAFTSDLNLCKLKKNPYKYWILFTHFHYIFTTCCWYKKQS
jgi:hypothetical protein